MILRVCFTTRLYNNSRNDINHQPRSSPRILNSSSVRRCRYLPTFSAMQAMIQEWDEELSVRSRLHSKVFFRE